MYKKYKVKRRKKNNVLLIISSVCISFLFMSFGYAFFSDTLTIKGTANIKQSNAEKGDSKYIWTIINSWENGGETQLKVIYHIQFNIRNNEGMSLDTWTLEFDVPDGLVAEQINAWEAKKVEVVGNTVKLTPHDWKAQVEDGGMVEFQFQLPFSTTDPLTITNVKFNGKLIQEVIE